MAVALTRVRNASHTANNKRVRVVDAVFSGNYATGGETITPSTSGIGLRVIEQIIPNGNLALSTDLATANMVGVKLNSTGTSATLTQYEGSAAGTALSEKTNGEAYATGSNIRLTVIGF